MGELFNSPHEWVGLITERLIDFIRVHISQIGGLTPARKIAALAEWFQVRTAWHGPGDVSPGRPRGQRAPRPGRRTTSASRRPSSSTRPPRTCSRAARRSRTATCTSTRRPGWGVDLNEELAKKFPLPENPGYWLPVRRRDGTAVRP